MQSDQPAAARRIDIETVLNESRLGAFRFRIIVICWLIAVLDGFDVQAMAFVAPVLAGLWEIPGDAMGRILTAGVAGLMVGSVLIGRFGDRIGRRPALLGSVVFFAAGSLATALSETVGQLMILRFLTGIGLGGTVVAALSLVVEYAPERSRTLLVAAMYIGFPIGGGVGGLIATPVIEAYGWQAVFVIGGAVPLAFLAAAWRSVPESLRFQVLEGRNPAKTGKLIERINDGYRYREGDRFTMPEQDAARGRVADLFAPSRRAGTLLLWFICFANLMVLYYLINWIPSILHSAGLDLSAANLGAVAFNVGGIVGALALGRAVDRLGSFRLLALVYLATAVVVWILANTSDIWLAAALTLLAGAGVLGAQICLGALIASFYPTALRSTGVGWALGVGRVGSILGPLLGGMAVAAGASPGLLISATAIPMLACGVAIALLSQARRKAVPEMP